MSYGQLVGPPPMEDNDVFPGDSTHPDSSTSQREPEVLKITVADPIKKVEQSMIPGVSGGYITYRVSTSTTLPSFSHPQVAVRRRFRDFVVRFACWGKCGLQASLIPGKRQDREHACQAHLSCDVSMRPEPQMPR